jgi:hypothetical protein
VRRPAFEADQRIDSSEQELAQPAAFTRFTTIFARLTDATSATEVRRQLRRATAQLGTWVSSLLRRFVRRCSLIVKPLPGQHSGNALEKAFDAVTRTGEDDVSAGTGLRDDCT